MRGWRTSVAAAGAAALLAFWGASPAKADMPSGSVGITGALSSFTTTTVTLGAASVSPGGLSGDFLTYLSSGGTPTVATFGGPINYTSGANVLSSLGGSPLFTITSADTSYATSLTLSTANVLIGSGTVIISGNGYLSLTGFTDPALGTYSITGNKNGLSLNFSSTAATVAIPAPNLGAGIPGLILACGGLFALLRRRRLQIA